MLNFSSDIYDHGSTLMIFSPARLFSKFDLGTKQQFDLIMETKGWTNDLLSKQWSLSERQIRRIIARPKQRDLDALKGLPVQLSDHCVDKSKDFLISARVDTVEFIYRIRDADQQLEIRSHTLPEHEHISCPYEYLAHLLRLGHHLLSAYNKANGLTRYDELTFNELFLRSNTINTAEYNQSDVCEGWTMLKVDFAFDVAAHSYEGFPYNPFELASLSAPRKPTWLDIAIAIDVMHSYTERNNLPDPFAQSRQLASDIFIAKVRKLGNFHNLSFPPPPQELIDELTQAYAYSLQGFSSRSEAYVASRPCSHNLNSHIHQYIINAEFLTDIPIDPFPRTCQS